MRLADFPLLNASLNGISAVLLLGGYTCIRLKQVKAHATLMLCATAVSAVFLTCYVIYHLQVPPHSLNVPRGWFSRIYFFILITHVILAVAIVPMILRTLYLAWKRKFQRHRRLARITFPLWFYVSVTGVIIYWMLYDLAPKLRQ